MSIYIEPNQNLHKQNYWLITFYQIENQTLTYLFFMFLLEKIHSFKYGYVFFKKPKDLLKIQSTKT